MKIRNAYGLAAAAGLAASSASFGQLVVLVTNQPGTFNDISATGTDITSGDDSSVAFTSGVTNAIVPTANLFASTNGNITSTAFATFTNAALPVASLSFGLFPFWDDLYVDLAQGGSLKHQLVNESGTPVEIVQWTNVRTFAGGTGSGTGTFQVKIFGGSGGPGGARVQFIYQSVSGFPPASANGASATVGVQTSNSSAAQFSFNTPSITDGMVISAIQDPNGGACCMPNGTCVLSIQSSCTANGGTFQGPGTQCGNCPPPAGFWIEQGDAGNLPSTAQVTTGSGSLNTITGGIAAADVDMFRINICNSGSFGATTVGTTTWDTKLFLFDANGMGVTMNDDSVGLQSTLTQQFIPGNGTYYIAISSYPAQADSVGGNIWLLQPFGIERQPDGPGAGSPVSAWSGLTGATGAYQINLTGTCYAQAGGGSTCYANCDLSTTNPFLNVLDFSCFLNKFAAGNTYANCDGSTIQPVLNVLDFSCFLNKFAAGCSAP